MAARDLRIISVRSVCEACKKPVFLVRILHVDARGRHTEQAAESRLADSIEMLGEVCEIRAHGCGGRDGRG